MQIRTRLKGLFLHGLRKIAYVSIRDSKFKWRSFRIHKSVSSIWLSRNVIGGSRQECCSQGGIYFAGTRKNHRVLLSRLTGRVSYKVATDSLQYNSLPWHTSQRAKMFERNSLMRVGSKESRAGVAIVIFTES